MTECEKCKEYELELQRNQLLEFQAVGNNENTHNNNNENNDMLQQTSNAENEESRNQIVENVDDEVLQKELSELDALHKLKKYSDIQRRIAKLLNTPKYEKNFEVLLRHARSCFDLAFEFPNNKKERERYIVMGRAVAEKMLEIDDQHWASHKWYALLVSAHGEFRSMKTKIGEAFLVKKHADIAAKLNPTDSTIFHLLGRWSFNVSNVGWIERKIAEKFISAVPPHATYEDALHFFLTAQKLQPNYIGNALWIGHTYLKLGQVEEAKQWYRKAMKLSPSCEADHTLIKESKLCLSKL